MFNLFGALGGLGPTGTAIADKLKGAGKLRNTAGHGLVWDDEFCTPANHDMAFQAVMDAIFRVIVTKLPMPSR